MLLSKVHRGPIQSEYRRLHFREFDQGDDAVGGGWSAEPADFVPAGAPKRAPGEPPPPPVDIEAIKQEAFARGRQAGLDVAEKRYGKSAEALGQALEEVSRLRDGLLKGSTHDMVRLVMAISRQVVQAELHLQPELVLKTIERALQAAVQSDSFTIKVNPRDLDLVREHKPLFIAGVSSLKNIVIEADPEIAAGGCRLESELGEVDATLESQMEEIRRTLLAAMERG